MMMMGAAIQEGRAARRVVSALLAGGLLLAACGGNDAQSADTADESGPDASAAAGVGEEAAQECDGSVDGPVELDAWYHSGMGEARDALTAQVEAFNERQDDVTVDLTLLPEGSYNEQVQSAAATGDLPDILDLDGPYLHTYAWAGDLTPIGSCVDDELEADLLPSVVNQGTFQGNLFGLSQMESGLGLYSRRSVLEENGIRIPSGPEDAWTGEEITEIALTLRDAGYERPLNLRWNNPSDEWYTHAFGPIIWSSGGDFIDRDSHSTADGFLNAPETVSALEEFQRWFTNDLVDPNEDDAAFEEERSVITWSGHWGYPGFHDAFGDDLLPLPLPDWGKGSKTGHGNWQWGVTQNVADVDAAWAFIEFLMEPDELRRIADVSGGIPVRKSVADESPMFGTDGPLRMYVEQLTEGRAVARPQTPIYPTITAEVAQALRDIGDGAPVQETLDGAVAAIDREIDDTPGYPED